MHRNLAVNTGFEPVLMKSKFIVLPLHQSTTLLNLVATERIELSFNAYETSVLPLNYVAIFLVVTSGIEPLFDDYQSPVLTIELCNNKLVGALGIEPRLIG